MIEDGEYDWWTASSSHFNIRPRNTSVMMYQIASFHHSKWEKNLFCFVYTDSKLRLIITIDTNEWACPINQNFKRKNLLKTSPPLFAISHFGEASQPASQSICFIFARSLFKPDSEDLSQLNLNLCVCVCAAASHTHCDTFNLPTWSIRIAHL